jgi:hypothetical protein
MRRWRYIRPQTAPILPIAGVGRGYHLRKGSQIGRGHKGSSELRPLTEGSPLKDQLGLFAKTMACVVDYRSCTVPLRRPVWSRTELSATRGRHKRGVPCPSARAPATLCDRAQQLPVQATGAWRDTPTRGSRAYVPTEGNGRGRTTTEARDRTCGDDAGTSYALRPSPTASDAGYRCMAGSTRVRYSTLTDEGR